MPVRIPPHQLQRAAEWAVADALRSLGARITRTGPKDADHDLELETPDGRGLRVQVKTAAVVTPAKAREWAVREPGAVAGIVVGDLISEGAKDILRERGWGWLDRRGHLRLEGPGLWVDARVAAAPRPHAPRADAAPIRGAAGLSVAAAALIWPAGAPGVRELARRVGLSPASVSNARARLRQSGLLSEDGRPAIPELFWATVPHWDFPRIPIARIPLPDEVHGLVAVGTRAAVSMGAPVVATRDHPVELLAPDAETYRRLRLTLGDAQMEAAPATVGMAPTPLAVDEDTLSDAWVEGWPVAHPLFIALELAQDAGRGSESLESWSPQGAHRVW